MAMLSTSKGLLREWKVLMSVKSWAQCLVCKTHKLPVIVTRFQILAGINHINTLPTYTHQTAQYQTHSRASINIDWMSEWWLPRWYFILDLPNHSHVRLDSKERERNQTKSFPVVPLSQGWYLLLIIDIINYWSGLVAAINDFCQPRTLGSLNRRKSVWLLGLKGG